MLIWQSFNKYPLSSLNIPYKQSKNKLLKLCHLLRTPSVAWGFATRPAEFLTCFFQSKGGEGRIIPYIMENKKCLKPPTRKPMLISSSISIRRVFRQPVAIFYQYPVGILSTES
jgi:hypothetical protein